MSAAVYLLFLSVSFSEADKFPSLKPFRDDYISITKTCEAVGYVKETCQKSRGTSIVAVEARVDRAFEFSQGNRAIYDKVLLNIGNGYNSSTGVFTAPKSGLYVFEWTTVTDNSKEAYTKLVINSRAYTYNQCQNNKHSLQVSCTKMAIVKLEAGHKAWITSYSGTASVMSPHSTLSLFML